MELKPTFSANFKPMALACAPLKPGRLLGHLFKCFKPLKLGESTQSDDLVTDGTTLLWFYKVGLNLTQ